MNWRVTVVGVQMRDDGFQLLRRHRAQRVWRNAKSSYRRSMLHDAIEQRIERFHVVNEALLPRIRWRTAKSRMGIKHRQHRESDAGSHGRGNNALSHLGGIGIRIAALVVMQVMKFSDAGIARLQHFDVQLRRDDFVVFRRDAL